MKSLKDIPVYHAPKYHLVAGPPPKGDVAVVLADHAWEAITDLEGPVILPDEVFAAFKQYMYDCSWDARVLDSVELTYHGRRFVSAVVGEKEQA